MSYEQFAYTYDRLMEGMPYAQWRAFAREAWRRCGLTPRTVVDLGCGTGSLAIPLAQEGLHVIGIDLSDDMLAVAQEKAERLGPFAKGGTLTWMQQDLRDWELAEPVDAVISFCDCFNYLLEEEDIVQALRRAYAGLKPGGVLAFDVHTPGQLYAYADSQPFHLNEDDVAYIWTCELDEERVQIEHDLTIFVRDQADVASPFFRRIDELHIQRAYPLEWLEQQLLAAGFTDVQVTADFTWQAPTSASGRAFFTAKK